MGIKNITYIEYGFEQHGIKWWEGTDSHDINLSTYYADYNNITVENIKSVSLLTAEGVSTNYGGGNPWGRRLLTWSYQPDTGILTLNTLKINFCMPTFLIIIEK